MLQRSVFRRISSDVNTHTKGAYRQRSLHDERGRMMYSRVFGATSASDATGSADGQVRRKQFLSFSDRTRNGGVERFAAREHWGFIVPLLAGVAETTHYTAVGTPAPSAPLSEDTTRRQFLFELRRNMPLLESSLRTATVPLLARFLAAHTTLGVTAPVVAALAEGEETAGEDFEARHAALLRGAMQQLDATLVHKGTLKFDARTARRQQRLLAGDAPAIAAFVSSNKDALGDAVTPVVAEFRLASAAAGGQAALEGAAVGGALGE